MHTPKPLDHHICEAIAVITHGLHIQGVTILSIQIIGWIFCVSLDKNVSPIYGPNTLRKSMPSFKLLCSKFNFLLRLWQFYVFGSKVDCYSMANPSNHN